MNADWSAAGGVALKLRGAHRADSAPVPWLGTMDFLDLDWQPAYVNQPMHFSKTHVEFTPLQRTITLSAADAFGSAWHGVASRKYSDERWTFDLSADHLDAAELDRWLGPRARPGFLARLTGANSVAPAIAPVADAVIRRIFAHGRLRVATIDVAPLQIEKFDGEADLTGRTVRVRMGQADFFGGKISGLFNAELLPDPSYDFQGRFDHVDLAQLAEAVPFLKDRLDGTASSNLTLSAHGVGRQDLVSSMQGQGTLEGKNVALGGVNFSGLFSAADRGDSSETFSAVQGTYRILAGGIDLSSLVLDDARGTLQAEGRIDFSHALNIRVRSAVMQASNAPASGAAPVYNLGGTIEIPKVLLPSAVPKAQGRPSSR
ncbi:MAG TPA: AsmA-like C-terminal region-containing protein [Candidatus Acidoferrales bacterium]|nr:AsmA-like C-terminal region-containing protein [Candidatus Acidoferrales bacterium]